MRTALAVTVVLLLACSGVSGEDEALSDGEAAAPEPTQAARPAEPPLPKAAGYTNNVYGVCRKYLDCECSLFPDVAACVEEFGEAREMFPPSVWSCVLARDCEGLCEFNAGTCFELYALRYTKGSKQGASECPAGHMAIEYYDAKGDYLRTECKE